MEKNSPKAKILDVAAHASTGRRFNCSNNKLAQQTNVAQEKQDKFLFFGLAALLITTLLYVTFDSKITHHDANMLAIEYSVTFVGGLIIVTYVVLVFLVSMFSAIKKRIRFIGFRVPTWFGKFALSLSVLLLPIYFIELRIEVAAKEAAKPIEAKQWFLAERVTSCGRRRLFRNCNNYLYDYHIYNRRGNRFNVSRYGDGSNYLCILGQRLANNTGRKWLKVDRVENIKYETNFHGRPTAKAKIALVKCTYAHSERSVNSDW